MAGAAGGSNPARRPATLGCFTSGAGGCRSTWWRCAGVWRWWSTSAGLAPRSMASPGLGGSSRSGRPWPCWEWDGLSRLVPPPRATGCAGGASSVPAPRGLGTSGRGDRGAISMIKTLKRSKKVKAGRPDPLAEANLAGEPEPVQQAAAWFVHLYTAMGLIFAAWIAVLLVRGGAERVSLVVPAHGGRQPGRRHRRDPGPPVPGQIGPARVRRAEARRPDRLPDLHLLAPAPGLAGRALSRGLRALAPPPAPGQRLRLLPGRGQDRRRLFPRVPVALERRRALSLRPATPAVVTLGSSRRWR